MDLHITDDRFGSNSDPSFNGHLHYPNDIDKSLNEDVVDKIRKHRADYNNNPPNSVSIITVICSTSGRLHCEFVTLSFLQDHRETDRFFATAGVQLPQHDRGLFHFRLVILQVQYPQTRFSTTKSIQPTLDECRLAETRNLYMGKQQWRRDITPHRIHITLHDNTEEESASAFLATV
jgi:hypothetical protein